MTGSSKPQEPSMDELLASIRRIISGDGPGETRRPIAGREPGQVFSSSTVRVPAQSQVAPPKADAPGVPQQMEGHAMADASNQDQASLQASLKAPLQAPARRDDPARAAAETGRRKALVSDGVDAAVAAAFESLGDAVLPSQARTVEDLIAQILRPMLKTWLDENLPGLVERMVRQEIERISRTGR